MYTAKIDKNKLIAWTKACMAIPIKYGLGAKVKLLGDQPNEVSKIDCSGFVRWSSFHATLVATGTGEVIPDGSVNIHFWLDKLGFEHHDTSHYSDLGLKDDVLRIGIITPASGGGVGHIFYCLNGSTMESHAGTGVDMRPWNTPVLQHETTDIYVIV